MHLLSENLNKQEIYKLLTGSVVPRPIAWISSQNSQSLLNLAPFSAFTYLSTDPPLIGFSIGYKPGTKDLKDTERNIREQKNFVCHIGSNEHIDLIQKSSFPYAADISEVSELGLEIVPSVKINTPRIKSAKIAMECKLQDIIDFGKDGSKFIIGEILAWYVDDTILIDGKIDSFDLDPAVRIAGLNYAKIANKINYDPK